MSLETAQSFAWNLARTLMTRTVLFRAGDGFAAMPTGEYDGDPREILCEYDPFDRR